MNGKVFQFETRAGEPISSGPFTIIPMARSLRIRLPRIAGNRVGGGLVWNRPVSIIVRPAQGDEYTLPVRDLTRRAQLALLFAGLAGGLLVRSAFRSAGMK
jgi:hypothetical protein